MSIKIYTKTGDEGKTSLIGGTRVPKSHIRIETYGTIDELNSYVGLLNDYLISVAIPSNLPEIQDRLFTIGSSLACDPQKEIKMKIPDLKREDITFLEGEIDRMEEDLSVMKSFILPGGHIAISTCHITRCVCRRAERLCVLLKEQEPGPETIILPYLNRLSDYLFILARHIAWKLGIQEQVWKPRI
ncbi:MAG: cob(I)yrinic acid a,c-diamide adenosyltransferase [Chitinophagaceae bacterium]